jgi:hypothetical protein
MWQERWGLVLNDRKLNKKVKQKINNKAQRNKKLIRFYGPLAFFSHLVDKREPSQNLFELTIVFIYPFGKESKESFIRLEVSSNIFYLIFNQTYVVFQNFQVLSLSLVVIFNVMITKQVRARQDGTTNNSASAIKDLFPNSSTY